MKKKTVGRIAIFTFALCMVSTCLLSGTLAKYTTTASGTGSVVVANFTNVTSIANKGSDVNYAFNLADTKDDNAALVNADVIAPGDKGQFDIVLGSSEVEYEYDLSITETNLTNVPIKFYTNEERSTEFANVTNADGVKTGTTITIYWDWKATEGAADNDAELLNERDDLEFTVSLTARQLLEARP